MIDHAADSAQYRWQVTQRFIVLFLLATALLCAAAIAHFLVSARAERIERETSELLNVELGKTAIASDLANVTSDLTFLARQGELQRLFDNNNREARDLLAQEFLLFVGQKGIYDQIRFLDDAGMERVRVNYNNGHPIIVPSNELQNKSHRYYFKETQTLGRDEVYISPLDLNIERGQIEQPPKPMIRFGTPVFDRTGNRQGILLLNYLGAKLIRSFRRAGANIADHVMLLNADGHWLSSPQSEDEWGFMYGNDHTFGKSYPDAWQRMAATSSGQFRSPQGLFSFTTVYPLQHVVGNGVRERMAEADKKYYWKVVAHLTPPRLQATPSNFLGRHLPLYLTMFALLAIASLLLARASVRHRHTTAQLDFERRFRKVLEGVDLLAVGLDAQGSIAFCNNALLQLAGRQRQAVIGQDWFETFVPQAQREHSKTLFHGMVSEETVPKRRESAIQTRTGEQRLISWNDTLLFDPHGQVIGVTCIGDDITEARQSEEQLRKLSRAVEQSPSTVIITGTDGTIEYVNPKFTELTGYGLDEVRGKNPRILKSGETSSAEYRYLWETITAGGEWRGVFHNKKKNGELYWEATCISPIRNAQGEITHFIAVKEDITERMRLEERFRRVVEATPNGIMMVNREGKIVLANFQTQRIFGYAREELIGQPVEMLIPERYRAAHPRYRSALFAEGKGLAMGIGQNLYGRRKDGKEVPLEIGLNPIDTEEGRMILAAVVDITERKGLEKELEERNREIARTQALTVMGRMAGMVAHDLRNPLSCIKMSLQMLGAQDKEDWEEAERELKQIALEQVRYMEELMSDLLSYSRPETLKPEWLNLEKILDTATILAQRSIDEHKVQVKTVYQAGLPTVHGDADKLRRAFSNIIVNAAQAVEDIKGRSPQINVATRLELGEDRLRIRVEICDNGRGIEPGQEENVFEPFFTTRAKGTGLGLAIVKRIIDQHRGSISLHPAGKQGTCAVVILPTGPIDGASTIAVDNDAADTLREPAAQDAVLVEED